MSLEPSYVNVLTGKRLIWETDTDWNKGTLGSDVEVFGTGTSASIRPNGETVSADTIYLTWHLNEDTGTSVNDSSIYNRDGTITVPEPYTSASFVSGKLNNALSWPGESEAGCYVDGGSIAGFEWDDAFSVDCWVNIADYEFIGIAGKYSNSEGKGWFVSLQSRYPRLDLVGSYGAENYLQVYGDVQVPVDAAYHHLVVTYDGTGISSGVKFYLDDVLLGNSVYFDNLAEVTIINSANFRVGALEMGWGYIGQIDEFVLYTKVLSQTDVDFRYNSTTGTEIPLETQEWYKTSAHYETNIFDSETLHQEWGIFGSKNTVPSGTSIEIKARVSNNSNLMGSFGSALVVGDSIDLSGQYIQFSVDFTGTITARADVDNIYAKYWVSSTQDVNP